LPSIAETVSAQRKNRYEVYRPHRYQHRFVERERKPLDEEEKDPSEKRARRDKKKKLW
jgi:hypothetical protein